MSTRGISRFRCANRRSSRRALARRRVRAQIRDPAEPRDPAMNRRDFLLAAPRDSAGMALGAPAGADRLRALRLEPLAAARRPRGLRRLDAGEPRRGRRIPRPALGPLPAIDRPRRRLGRRGQTRLPDDAARGVRHRRQPLARLRMALSQHRLRRHHHRPAYGRADDQHAGGQARRQGVSRSAPARATSRPI